MTLGGNNGETSVKECNNSNSRSSKESDDKKFYGLKAGLFLGAASGLGLLAGFGGALGAVRKQSSPSHEGTLDKALERARLEQSGARLALKALAHGTVYACLGCGLLFWGIWKISGAEDLRDFRNKAGLILPKITKDVNEGRTEFSGLNDLLSYLIEQDEAEKAAKNNKASGEHKKS